MEALSRREESDLLEKGKKEAMKHCEEIVKGEIKYPHIAGALHSCSFRYHLKTLRTVHREGHSP